ncbi:RNA helicase [Cunninghamella echinulata]|nr:RNA helicase [Cunninghamella echinulata]
MSRQKRRQQKTAPPIEFDWNASPSVVSATLNTSTNEFDIASVTGGKPKKKLDERKIDSPLISTTFKLNTNVDNEPIFSQVTDYTLFRNKPVIPHADDILYPQIHFDEFAERSDNKKDSKGYPNIPVNHIQGAYKSIDHYLYTHFELMRQDFLIPLQKAVKSYKATLETQERLKIFSDDIDQLENKQPTYRDYRLYEQVQLNAVVFGNRQVLYRVSFRLPHYVGVSWPTSKRLIEGTLVLLSKDNFENDIKIATVVQRGDNPMKGSNRFEYMIDIQLERDNPEDPLGFGDPTSETQDTYIMIEATDGYFEAYRHILKVIKEIPSEELPFEPYLINVDKEVRIPYYASLKRYYDLESDLRSRKMGHRKVIDIMGTWVPYDIGLDKTQTDALQTILSNDVAIVQGPPGTGKSYVGNKAMQTFLTNFDEALGPIICICQTNHALDQFLEHIFEYNENIVRIGGRSKSEKLKDRLIYELRKNDIGRGPSGVGKLYRKREELADKINDIIVEMYEEPCVTIDFIEKQKLLRPRQIEELKRLGQREEKHKTNFVSEANGDTMDDDDLWVITSQPTVKPESPHINNNRSKNNNNYNKSKRNQKNQVKADDWLSGNLNLQTEMEKSINPVEIWLQDAIEYVGSHDIYASYVEDLKDEFLEQKGLVYEDDNNEDELMDEEEMQEIAQNYFDGQDLRGNKNRYVNIGKAYKNKVNNTLNTFTFNMFGNMQQHNLYNNDPNGRKIINYEKTDRATRITSEQFDFFNDGDDLSYQQQHEVLERWMKNDEVTMWPLAVRLKAHKKWAALRRKEYEKQLNALIDEYNKTTVDIRKKTVLNDAKICKENRVIGMTSTAAAKYRDLLEEVQPTVIIVEEAAEMLESHIVAALTNSLQHLILIGDHQQLRPSTAVHALSEYHHLNVSLFERLVLNDFPYTRLSHQRRMRPDIRSLIDPIYSNPPLLDHEHVLKYPDISGMAQNIYFLAHEEEETHVADTASKSNIHEAQMTAKLSVYLLLQGYRPEHITIITMYSGQRAEIKRQLRAERRIGYDPSAIQVSSVDGYQGEENEIIIVSLVRSNMQGQIGFLKVANRVCVALSRAKHGCYIFGNARLLCEKSELWNEIIANMEDGEKEMIGTKLNLKCAQHGTITKVQWPVDFTETQEGGCKRICGRVLDCGHQCPLQCHTYEHDDVRCKSQCRKIFTTCGHQCTKMCSDDCGSCTVQVRLTLSCAHTIEGDCGKLRREIKAQQGKCPQCLKIKK